MLAPSQDQGAARSGSWRTDRPFVAALVVAVVGAATIAGAWFFELVLKLQPCPLCLEQRWPYYIGVPLALVIALAARLKAPRAALVAGLLALAAVMLWGTYLGVFHAGIEWGFWTGPQECSGTPQFGGPGGLLDRLKDMNPTRCDAAAWRFLGLSLAGYNALITLGLAIVAAVGAIGARRP